MIYVNKKVFDKGDLYIEYYPGEETKGMIVDASSRIKYAWISKVEIQRIEGKDIIGLKVPDKDYLLNKLNEHGVFYMDL